MAGDVVVAVDVEQAVRAGVEFVDEAELQAQVSELAQQDPSLASRAERWAHAQSNPPHVEREVVFKSRVPASVIETPAKRAMRGGSKALGVFGVIMTIKDIGAAAAESYEQESAVPLLEEVARQGGGWAGAAAGAAGGTAVGGVVGLETGPGALVVAAAGGLVGGVAGYYGADYLVGLTH